MIGLSFTQTTYEITPRWRIDRIYWRKHWTPFVKKSRTIWLINMPASGFAVGDLLAYPGPIKEMNMARIYYIEENVDDTTIYLTVPFTLTGEWWARVLYGVGLRGKLARKRIFKGKK